MTAAAVNSTPPSGSDAHPAAGRTSSPFFSSVLWSLARHPPPHRKYLVYTSAGSNSQWYENWLCPEREFDVFVAYWGLPENEQPHRLHAERFMAHAGSKWQNLFLWFHSDISLFDGYDYVAVWDDDTQMSCTSLSAAFEMSQHYDLWVSQPAVTNGSKISHWNTVRHPALELAYTGMIEMNAPIFRRVLQMSGLFCLTCSLLFHQVYSIFEICGALHEFIFAGCLHPVFLRDLHVPCLLPSWQTPDGALPNPHPVPYLCFAGRTSWFNFCQTPLITAICTAGASTFSTITYWDWRSRTSTPSCTAYPAGILLTPRSREEDVRSPSLRPTSCEGGNGRCTRTSTGLGSPR